MYTLAAKVKPVLYFPGAMLLRLRQKKCGTQEPADCFTDLHGAHCILCKKEYFTYSESQRGKTAAEIRQRNHRRKVERSGPRGVRYSSRCEIAAVPSEHVRIALTPTRTEGLQSRSAKTFLSRNFASVACPEKDSQSCHPGSDWAWSRFVCKSADSRCSVSKRFPDPQAAAYNVA